MKQKLCIITACFLTLLFGSCRQAENKEDNDSLKKEVPGLISTGIKLVDYKSDRYKIAIGESYKISGKAIDWRWAALADKDDKIDSTGKDAFMSLDEPLIKYNESEWLPSLHIETDKNLITSFTCSILFNLEKDNKAAGNFLQLLKNDIKQLAKEEIINALKTKGIYEIREGNFIETFKLTKPGEPGYDKFEYTVQLNK